jgi:hypothetical protein
MCHLPRTPSRVGSTAITLRVNSKIKLFLGLSGPWRWSVRGGYRPIIVFLIFRLHIRKIITCMKNGVFWDVAPFRSCVNRRFEGTYRLHLQGRKIRERGTSVSRWLQTESPKRRFTQDLHGATSQKTAFFIWHVVSTLEMQCLKCVLFKVKEN